MCYRIALRKAGMLWETVKDRGSHVLQSMGSQRVRHDLYTEQQQQGMPIDINVIQEKTRSLYNLK